jgi:hypothetical protein
MIDRNLARGLFLCAVALAFGLSSTDYGLGSFSRAGPGLFPLMVSSLLLLIGVLTVVRSRFVEKVPLHFNVRNIGILLAALCAFALVSKLLNMTAGIAVMVLIAAFAGTSYSVARNLKIAAGLLAIAFAFQKLLGLNLPLY